VQALVFAQRRMGALRRSGQFADPQPVDDDAPPIERLAALSGRCVTCATNCPGTHGATP
jgi:hypothetical protein